MINGDGIDIEGDGTLRIAKTQLAKVHAPIGIKIKSQTPEEIAVSIAAQIITIKNKK